MQRSFVALLFHENIFGEFEHPHFRRAGKPCGQLFQVGEVPVDRTDSQSDREINGFCVLLSLLHPVGSLEADIFHLHRLVPHGLVMRGRHAVELVSEPVEILLPRSHQGLAAIRLAEPEGRRLKLTLLTVGPSLRLRLRGCYEPAAIAAACFIMM